MAANSLAPGYVILHYAVTFGTEIHTHKQTLPVQPQLPVSVGSEPTFVDNNGDDILMSDAIDAYILLAKELFNTSCTFIMAEYWNKPTPESDPIWVYTYTIGVTGNRVGTAIEAGQITHSFRTEGGGIFKLVYLETPFVATYVDLYPFADADVTDLTDYLCSGVAWIHGRDGEKPAIPIKGVGKINDALRRKYILTS